MFDLPSVVNWLMSFGAPAPTFEILHVNNPGGTWDWPQLVFTNQTQTYPASVELLTREPNGPSVALAELAKLGLAPNANPSIPVAFVPKTTPTPPPPAPVDAFVGLPDPAHAGFFQPTPTTSSMWLYYQFLSGEPHITPDGRKFEVKPINGGLMTTFGFVEVK